MSLFNLKFHPYHTIKDDGIVSRLKFVRIREDYLEYGLPIPDMMLNDAIKQLESYQMFLKYLTDQIPPKKSRGKGSQRKKTADNPVVDVDISEGFKPEPAKKKIRSRSRRGVVIQDSPKEAADIMQALKDSNKTSRRQPYTKGSNKGTFVSLGVPDESTVIPATVKEDQGDDKEVDWIDYDEDEEKKDDIDDNKSIDLEMTDDEFVQGVKQVNDDEDEEMTSAEVKDSGNGDAKICDAAKADAEKTKEVKDDANKAELPLTSSSLSISLVLAPLHETPLVATVTSLSSLSVCTIPPIPHKTIAPILTPPITIDDPTITTAVPEFDALFAVQLRFAKLEKDVSELKKIDHSAKALASFKSQVPIVVDQYLGSKIGNDLQKRHTTDLVWKYSVKPTLKSIKIQRPIIDLEQDFEKSALEIRKINREQAEKQKMPKYTIKSTDKAALKEY
nr:hypothetical protein [Tanacetum cinerariifolium]